MEEGYVDVECSAFSNRKTSCLGGKDLLAKQFAADSLKLKSDKLLETNIC